jgi:gentisate 1,2-dioxygenase
MRLSRLTTRRELIASDRSSKREVTMSPKSATARLPNRDTALKTLYEDIATKKMFPFWATSADVEHDEIKQLMGTQRALPHLWNYKNDIEPILYRAADLITMDDSERRSLILINPGWRRSAPPSRPCTRPTG